jgi:endonuclease/exonuclease/phosphatase family metal-dependent hydrolase
MRGMETVKILQWNVWYYEKCENIVNFLKHTNADIVCCQELTVNFKEANPGIDVPAKIAKACNYNYYFQPTTIVGTDGEELKMGNAIFTRFPIKNKTYSLVQQAGSFPGSEDRAYIELDIEVNSKMLKVGTVHLSYSPAFAMNEKKLGEAEKLYDAVVNNHEKYILTGDMNAKPDSPIIKRLEEIFIHADPNTDRPTWTTKPFSYQGFEANSRDWRLDYIFATEDINIIENKIIDTPYSDHLPILSKIQI